MEGGQDKVRRVLLCLQPDGQSPVGVSARGVWGEAIRGGFQGPLALVVCIGFCFVKVPFNLPSKCQDP